MITCPHCHSEQAHCIALLGFLGRRTHYRCRYCGGEWSRARKPRKVKT